MTRLRRAIPKEVDRLAEKFLRDFSREYRRRLAEMRADPNNPLHGPPAGRAQLREEAGSPDIPERESERRGSP